MNAAGPGARLRWERAWIDFGAFALGLGCAWAFDWTTTDLVWSLWLSSLVVGYAMIVWTITAPLRGTIGTIAADKTTTASVGGRAAVVGVMGVGTLFGLAFFTVHFGGFHFVHSAFLATLFPLTPGRVHGFPNLALYTEVFRRYWWFLPAAALAEREAFKRVSAPPPNDTAVTPQAITLRLRRGSGMMEPYRNVIRLHLLIFFFIFAHLVRLTNFAVYAVAYAVYFFPWRRLKRNEAGGSAA